MIGNLFGEDHACSFIHVLSQLLVAAVIVKAALPEVVPEMFQASLFVHEGLATSLFGPRAFRTLVCRGALFQEPTPVRHLVREWR